MKMSFTEYRNATKRTDAANAHRKVRKRTKGYDRKAYDGTQAASDG